MYSIAREEQDVDDMENLSLEGTVVSRRPYSREDQEPRKEIMRQVNNNLDRQGQISKIMNPAIFNL